MGTTFLSPTCEVAVIPRFIQYVLRSLAETSPTVSDADLLRQFSANEVAAFGELVRRHGRE